MSATATSAAEVLAFWFGHPPAGTPRREWFQKDEAFDAHIRNRFGALLEAGLGDGLRYWRASPQAALARILVLDQFTRNAFRDTARAFAGDALALADARALVAHGDDLALPPLARWFVYLPFEHSENMAMQHESLRLFTALAVAHPTMADAREWAHKHFVVVQRFGRYPHRNALLGRANTAEEAAFLREPGSAF